MAARRAIRRYNMNISGLKAGRTVACCYIGLHYSVVTKSLFLTEEMEGLNRNFAVRKE